MNMMITQNAMVVEFGAVEIADARPAVIQPLLRQGLHLF
jgi:hypothetical protein